MRLRISLRLWLGLLLSGLPLHAEEATTAEVHKRLSVTFIQTDTNRDQKLSLAEFLTGRDHPAVAKRDFRMCDFDDDQHLSLEEFLTVPSVVPVVHRGPMPDMMSGMVDGGVALLDTAFDDWQKDPDREIEAKKLLYTVSEQMEQYGELVFWPAVDEVDPDGSGNATRAEARRFVEIHMGVRSRDGSLLRLGNGQVINRMLFLQADEDRDHRLNQHEFVARSGGDKDVADEFLHTDADHDGFISFAEWCLLKGRALCDPVEEFCRMDANLDARLDAVELLTGTPDRLKPLARCALPGFDWNKDGVLSLAEYRTTMQANLILPWYHHLHDKNGDGTLSVDEFHFDHYRQFAFLRLLYFQRLDLNGSKRLEPNEWPFRAKLPNEFVVMNEDGSDWKPFFRFADHDACGSPAVSPDGRRIAFAARPNSDSGSSVSGSSVVFDMPVNGGNLQRWETGLHPSWSPDGLQLVCSRQIYDTGIRILEQNGVWLLERNENATTAKKLDVGWGPRWSPDGKQIAYCDQNSLLLFDIRLQTSKVAVNEPARFREICWNMAWSPDSQKLCFKGVSLNVTRAGTKREQVVAIVDLTQEVPQIKIRHSRNQPVNACFTWHPTQNRVVYSMWCNERNLMQLYEFDPTRDDPPKLMAGQDATRNNTDACWTPDGKRLIVISGDF
ncbi:MAG: hypothetical protein Q8K78_00685 [Planctomycetaceae bacterium]|nr:hypothetical protein [Planctomycetaceae bacterium]